MNSTPQQRIRSLGRTQVVQAGQSAMFGVDNGTQQVRACYSTWIFACFLAVCLTQHTDSFFCIALSSQLNPQVE